jgi:hypothetical protein
MSEPVSDHEHAVFETVLRAAYIRRGFFGLFGPYRRKLVVVKQEARTFIPALVAVIPEEERQPILEKEIAHWGQRFPTLSLNTISDYVEKSRVEGIITRPFDLPVRSEIWPFGGWFAFRERFPKSGELISFSRAGIGKDGTQAIVEVGDAVDGLAGMGQMFFLVCEANSWRVVSSMATWIS